MQSQPLVEGSAMIVTSEKRKKFKLDVTCGHCGKASHAKENCYKLFGFPFDFKFTKNKNPSAKKLGSSNSVMVNVTTAGNEEHDSAVSKLSFT